MFSAIFGGVTTKAAGTSSAAGGWRSSRRGGGPAPDAPVALPEYQARRVRPHLIGEGEPLARALRRSRRRQADADDVNPAEATAYIINPLSGRKVNFANLFSTHPPTEERIARLRSFDRTHAI